MKAIIRTFLILTVVLALAVNLWASPVTFTPDPSASSVCVTVAGRCGALQGNLALNNTPFTLDDNETQELDFFTLTASGWAWNTDYNISARLTFSDPSISISEKGSGQYSTFLGLLSGGTLSWNTATIPETFTLADGNQVKIDFEDGWTIGLGNKVTVHAFVTNLGGATVVPDPTTAVPEPTTILLLGIGLIGMGVRRKFQV